MKTGKAQLNLFIIGLLAGTFAYFLTISIFSVLIFRTFSEQENMFSIWKAMLYHSMPSLFAVLAFSFCSMQMKELYLLACIMMTGWVFDWMKVVTTFEPETYLIMTYGLVICFMVFSYPLINWICASKHKFEKMYMSVSCLLVILMDVLIFTYNKCVFPYRNVVHLIVKIIIFAFFLATTLFSMRYREEQRGFEEEQKI